MCFASHILCKNTENMRRLGGADTLHSGLFKARNTLSINCKVTYKFI